MWITTLIEVIFGLSLFVNAALFIPQIITLYKSKDAKGLSLLTFAGFNLIQLFTVLHAYINKDYLLMAGYVLSIVTCGAVTFLIILYKNN